MKRFSSNTILLLAAAAVIVAVPQLCSAEPIAPTITINTSGSGETSSAEVYSGIKLAILFTILGFIPSLVMTATCFTRIAIVLSMTRQALGTVQTPPNQVLIGLSLFLTFTIMSPIFNRIYAEALIPYSEDQITHQEALSKAYAPLRDFMLRHTRENDLNLFMEITNTEAPDSPDQLGPNVVVPAFLISELNSAFQIAFLIWLTATSSSHSTLARFCSRGQVIFGGMMRGQSYFAKYWYLLGS